MLPLLRWLGNWSIGRWRGQRCPELTSTPLCSRRLVPGKQHQLDVVKTLLTTAGMGDLIGPGDFSSVQALQQLIKEKNSCISVMDEFGSFLRRIKDGAQMSNIREITGEMRTLWSSWIQYDSVKKAKDDSVRVYSPAFAIFGVTTAGDFYSALKIEDASNGFLNRFLILEETSRGEEKEPEGWVGDVPFALMERLHKTAAKYQSAAGGSRALLDPPGPVKPQSKLGWGPDAFKLYQQFNRSIRSESDDRVLELRIRAPEMAVRLATIRACGRLSETVDVDDIEWAIELARASADMLCAGVAEHVVPEGLDGLCEKIIEVVRRKNGVCSARDIYRSVRRRIKRANDLEAALAYLVERGTDKTGISGWEVEADGSCVEGRLKPRGTNASPNFVAHTKRWANFRPNVAPNASPNGGTPETMLCATPPGDR